MDLFDSIIGEPHNLLPRNGIVNYYGTLMSAQKSDNYFDVLHRKVEWKHDEVIVLGKHIHTKRKIAWYGDRPFKYTYSNTTKQALAWIDELLELKLLVEETLGETFNSCLLNLYHTGSEGMTWHSDAEKDLKKNAAIASLSFGAERKFSFKHKKSKETVSLILQKGSLLVMKSETQDYWMHSLPKTTKINLPRINLTFRTMTI